MEKVFDEKLYRDGPANGALCSVLRAFYEKYSRWVEKKKSKNKFQPFRKFSKYICVPVFRGNVRFAKGYNLVFYLLLAYYFFELDTVLEFDQKPVFLFS